MADAGHTVQAHDLDASRFGASGIPLWTHDLNQPVPAGFQGRTYDLVVAMEVIEHLRDPLGFLETCRAFCRLGGLVLLTTPNTVDPLSYARYLKRGQFLYLNPTCYGTDGHIAVLPFWLLECHFRQVGLEVVDARSLGRNSPLKGRLVQWGQSVVQGLLGARFPRSCGGGIASATSCGVRRDGVSDSSASGGGAWVRGEARRWRGRRCGCLPCRIA